MMTTTARWRSCSKLRAADPLFRGDAGRNGLCALFGLLGEQDARTQRYRAELLNIVSRGTFSVIGSKPAGNEPLDYI